MLSVTQIVLNTHGGYWQVITADVVDFDAPAAAFDRVMSIEMFEHMKNYQVSRSSWLDPCRRASYKRCIGMDRPLAYCCVCRCSWGASASG